MDTDEEDLRIIRELALQEHERGDSVLCILGCHRASSLAHSGVIAELFVCEVGNGSEKSGQSFFAAAFLG
jgi:hypothetical protein